MNVVSGAHPCTVHVNTKIPSNTASAIYHCAVVLSIFSLKTHHPLGFSDQDETGHSRESECISLGK